MSKRNRHSDNSKRQQPVQQQRAQARQNTPNPGKKVDSNPPGRDKQAANDQRG